MLFRKKVVLAAMSLSFFCAPLSANQYGVKGQGPILELEQQMLLFESDIFVGRTDRSGKAENMQLRGLGLSSAFSRWFNGIVPYQFHDNMSTGGREVARQAIAHWNEQSSISLVERDPNSPDAPDDYVLFVNGPSCASWVGRQGHAQEIWVSDYCTAGSVIHEIGHALGLLHEHTRSDRDQYIQVFWENIQDDKAFNFEINTSGTTDLGEYNFNSIMHYGEYFFSKTGQRTMQAINAPSDAVLGQRTGVSPGDLAAINSLYGTDLGLSMDLSVNDGTTDVTFTVSNLHSIGAHSIVLGFNSGGLDDATLSLSQGVSCTDDSGFTECRIAVLPGGDMQIVSLSVPRVLSEHETNPQLSSKTFDLNLGNNGLPSAAAALAGNDSRSVDGEPVTVADLGSGLGANDGGSGGGSVYRQGLLALLGLLLLRLANAVTGFRPIEPARSQRASTAATASSRRASR